MRSERVSPTLGFVFVFVASFCLYAFSASPALGWLDSPEFVAQAATLGNAHSPGHPLPALLGRAAAYLPIGDMVWRINLMSSLCAALSLTLLFAVGRSILDIATPEVGERARSMMALLFTLVVGVSWALWSNAVRAEVYALQVLVSAGILYGLLQFEKDGQLRQLLLASFFTGLGLANHHLMTLVVFVPGVLLVFTHKKRPGLKPCVAVAGMGIVALLSLVYLPLRSLAQPLVNFGAPHTLDRFIWTLSGSAFAGSAHTNHVSSPLLDMVQALIAIAEALSLPVFLLAIFGLIVGLKPNPLRRWTLYLFGVALLCVAARVLLGFDPETPDHHAYLLPAIFSFNLLGLLGLANLCTRALHARRPLHVAPAMANVAMIALVFVQLALHWQQSNHQDAWASDELARWEVEQLDPNALVLVSYFQTTFRHYALQAIEAARPDLAILDRGFLTYPGMAEQAKAKYPELSELIDAPLKAGAASPMQKLHELAQTRSVVVQLDPNVDDVLSRKLAPHGAFAHLVGKTEESLVLQSDDQRARQRLDAIWQRANPAERDLARGALLWIDANRLMQFCQLAQKEAAQKAYHSAKELAPNDTMLKDIALRCGLTVPPSTPN
jgi:hypothetical protein